LPDDDDAAAAASDEDVIDSLILAIVAVAVDVAVAGDDLDDLGREGDNDGDVLLYVDVDCRESSLYSDSHNCSPMRVPGARNDGSAVAVAVVAVSLLDVDDDCDEVLVAAAATAATRARDDEEGL
jgi:hypothetical protein